MTPEAGKKRRTHILVDARSQAYLSLLLVLYLLVYTLVLLAVMLAPSIVTFSRSSLPWEERFAASREFLFMDQRVVPAVILFMFLLGAHFLLISHRIFGPLHRLRNVLARWREGVWPYPLQVRPKDFHQELFTEVNALADRFRGDLYASRDSLNRALDEARAIAREGLPPPAAEQLSRLENECRQALDLLGRLTRTP